VIKEADAHTRGAWADGWLEGDNKIVINTDNVHVFRLNLSRLRINRDKRLILRLDGYSSELRRDRPPLIHFRRTPAGAWEVFDPNS